ncbi:MAG TPA: ribosome small subunit-dependent GTPase A [Anaeromyxobacter sp.]|nr:ribosome small subunit-dependent GTPase A [Anaeromyxobacter sp.]
MAGPVLEALGFGPSFQAQVSAEERAALLPGRAVADRGRRLAVRFEDGERLVTVPGRLRAAGEVPVVGDFVLASPGDEPAVARVLRRASKLSRGAAGRAEAEQVLAANVDLVFVVHGLDAGVKARRLERELAAVHASGAAPVVVLTKIDLADDEAEVAGYVDEAVACAAGAPVVPASGKTGAGLEAIRAALAPGRTGVFVGPSGAGKSTLVNALLGAEVQAVKEVRERDARGRHATTGRRLFPLPGGGSVIDGPGIRELKLWDAAGIAEVFEEVAALAAACRFRDCRHGGEPGCAVREAVEEGRLDPERLESYLDLEAEARNAEARRSGAHARAEKQRWRAISREIRRFYRRRGDE